MVSFRPHTLTVIREGAGSKAENGDWTPGKETRSAPVPCRYEPNSVKANSVKANEITLPDGKAFRYSYIVYVDVNAALDIQYGDLIELTSQDGVAMGRYEVKGFHRGQLNMKIWV